MFCNVRLAATVSWRERERKRTSPRKPGFDYSTPGNYFITARLRPYMHELAEIDDGCSCLTDFGRIVEWCWHDLPNHYGNVELDAFVVMPDHIHGIIRLLDLSAVIMNPPGLPEVVRGLKTSSSRRINNLLDARGMSIWAPSFHDRIIRTDDALIAARQYIRNNPVNWVRTYDAKKHPT